MHYGDTVKHSNAGINNGHPMTVSSMNEDETQALCRLDDDSEEWFDVQELTVVGELDDSFI
ncbi:hypothetical protein GCM10028803_28830 [Larkinella knui]|uniref:Uncharacterized protein n=1 Tax=Larkinella knui TaxID=2025310 RepID=A0A3P1CXM5_9BACT|nr:hypothetical protein [Larkinella knui]RRB17918.1 hypothetical protein EHT87_06485 [Larkinella knui]